MTYREAPANAVLERPPQLLGFALYVFGAGLAIVGVAQAVLFQAWVGEVAAITQVFPVAILVGQIAAAIGLAIAWKSTKPPYRRVIAVATALWLTTTFAEQRNAQLTSLVRGAYRVPEAGIWFGWATTVVLLAFVVHRGGRAFASRTWAATFGAVALVARACHQAWLSFAPQASDASLDMLHARSVVFAVSAIAFAFAGAGFVAAGRMILRGITVAEYLAGRSASRADRDVDADADASPTSISASVPLLADASVSIAGMNLLSCGGALLSLAMLRTAVLHEVPSSAGGDALAFSLLVVALRRLGPASARAALAAGGAVLTLLLAAALAYFHVGTSTLAVVVQAAPWFFVAYALHAVPVPLAMRSRLRAAAAALAVAQSAVALGRLWHELSSPCEVGGGIAAAYAFYATIRAASEARRIEIALAAPKT